MGRKRIKFPKHFKIAFVPVKHIFEICKEGNRREYKGIEAEFLKTLSKSLNFSFHMIVPQDKTWGSKDSFGNWKGVIGMVNRGEADIGLSRLDITESRSEAVDFSFPYDVADKTFATEHPQMYPSYASFTYPFNISVWIFLFIAFILMCFSLLSLSTREYISVNYVIKLFGTLCKQPYTIKETSTMWKIVFILWCLFMTVITLSYSAVLFAYLTIPLKEEGISTVRALSKAVEKGFYKCLISNGTNDLYLLLGSEQRDLKVIGQKAVLRNWFYDATLGSEDNYIEPHTAIMANRISLSTPAFHDRFVSDDSFGVWYMGIAVGKSFCCKERLNLAILRILGSGLFQRYQEDELAHSGKIHLADNNAPKLDHLSFEDVYAIFFPLFFGYALSILAFLGELLMFYYQNNVSYSFTT